MYIHRILRGHAMNRLGRRKGRGKLKVQQSDPVGHGRPKYKELQRAP